MGDRLPWEAEWEFACRAGTTTKFWTGDDDEGLKLVAWIAETRSHAVAQFDANPFGLHHVHGNVWVWTLDRWEPNYYEQFANAPAVDPRGTSAVSAQHIVRGGVWSGLPSICRSSYRFPFHTFEPDFPFLLGIRVAVSVDAVRELLKR